LEWWRECSRVVALTPSFNFDDFSAQIAKQHGTVRTGNDSSEIDNANAFERSHGSPHESVAANSAKSATIMSG
jgi:hypothetical protein